MSIKRILVPLPGSAEHAAEIETALSAAKALGAHVEALFIREPPRPAQRGRDVFNCYKEQLAITRPIDRHAEAQAQLAQEAHERFAAACAAVAIPLLPANEMPATLPAASWRVAEGSYDTIAATRAAAFDITVAASAAVVAPLKGIAEKSLLQTRRPVLLAPSEYTTELTDTAMVAWDESLECWHALSAALPFLQRARSVQVLSVDRNPESRRASQMEALAYLRCHGIAADAQVIAPHLRPVGSTLLAEADEQRVGLLVMGAYSHSRLREMLLGGATRYILQNAISQAVLMAH